MKRARTPAAALLRRVIGINGLIFVMGTLILALSPATVSSRIRLTEIPVLSAVVSAGYYLALRGLRDMLAKKT